jgi:hypothetical protein
VVNVWPSLICGDDEVMILCGDDESVVNVCMNLFLQGFHELPISLEALIHFCFG